MEQQLRELIQKNLPEYAAKEMAAFIDQAIKDKKALEETMKQRDAYRDSSNLMAAENTKLKAEAITVADMKNNTIKLAEDVKEQSRNQKVFELTTQLAAKSESMKELYGLVGFFVKNPRAIELISTSNMIDHGPYHYDNQGRQIYEKHPVIDSSNETRESSETKEDYPKPL